MEGDNFSIADLNRSRDATSGSGGVSPSELSVCKLLAVQTPHGGNVAPVARWLCVVASLGASQREKDNSGIPLRTQLVGPQAFTLRVLATRATLGQI